MPTQAGPRLWPSALPLSPASCPRSSHAEALAGALGRRLLGISNKTCCVFDCDDRNSFRRRQRRVPFCFFTLKIQLKLCGQFYKVAECTRVFALCGAFWRSRNWKLARRSDGGEKRWRAVRTRPSKIASSTVNHQYFNTLQKREVGSSSGREAAHERTKYTKYNQLST